MTENPNIVAIGSRIPKVTFMNSTDEHEPEFVKVTLLMQVDQDDRVAQPHKWDYQRLLNHPHEVEVLECEYGTVEDLT